MGCRDRVFESSLKCLVGCKLIYLPKRKKRTLQRRRMTIKEFKLWQVTMDGDCMDKPWALLNLRLLHVTFQHLQPVTYHGLTRRPKPETLETQGLLPALNISLRSTGTDSIANRGSWQKMPSHLQTCSGFFPSDRYLTSELRGHREFFVETYEARLWCIKRKTNLKLAYSAGTKHPHIAMTLSSPICRKYVLFPIRGWGSTQLFDDKGRDYQTYYHKNISA